jgi:hypothetical protein
VAQLVKKIPVLNGTKIFATDQPHVAGAKPLLLLRKQMIKSAVSLLFA